MNDLIVMVLAMLWIPTAYGTVRSWMRYWRVRPSEGAWLMLIIAVVATLATPIVIWISAASLNRLIGNPPFEHGVIVNTLIAFIAGLIVPVIEFGFWLWERGSVAAPTVPSNDGGKHG